jgi:hypothetical protein
MVKNVVLMDGDYDQSDKDLLVRLQHKVFYGKRPGGEDIPWLNNYLILLCPEGEDYHEFMDRKTIWLQKNHGPTILISPGPLQNTPTVPHVDMSNFQRLSNMLNMGVVLGPITSIK